MTDITICTVLKELRKTNECVFIFIVQMFELVLFAE